MIDKITHKIQQAIPHVVVHVTDPNNDGRHFEAIVISEQFIDQTLVQQHQLVMNALKDEFKDVIHALQLKTFTPEAWRAHNERR